MEDGAAAAATNKKRFQRRINFLMNKADCFFLFALLYSIPSSLVFSTCIWQFLCFDFISLYPFAPFSLTSPFIWFIMANEIGALLYCHFHGKIRATVTRRFHCYDAHLVVSFVELSFDLYAMRHFSHFRRYIDFFPVLFYVAFAFALVAFYFCTCCLPFAMAILCTFGT